MKQRKRKFTQKKWTSKKYSWWYLKSIFFYSFTRYKTEAWAQETHYITSNTTARNKLWFKNKVSRSCLFIVKRNLFTLYSSMEFYFIFTSMNYQSTKSFKHFNSFTHFNHITTQSTFPIKANYEPRMYFSMANFVKVCRPSPQVSGVLSSRGICHWPELLGCQNHYYFFIYYFFHYELDVSYHF